MGKAAEKAKLIRLALYELRRLGVVNRGLSHHVESTGVVGLIDGRDVPVELNRHSFDAVESEWRELGRWDSR